VIAEAADSPSKSGPSIRTAFLGLNGIRAVGALLVLTTHVGFHSGAALNSTFNGLLSRMDVGVAIFWLLGVTGRNEIVRLQER